MPLAPPSDTAAQPAPPEPRAAESGGEEAAPSPPASLAESEAEEAVAAPAVAPTVDSAPARAVQQSAVPLAPPSDTAAQPAPPVEVPTAVVVPREPEPDPYAALPLLGQLPDSIQAAIPELPVSVHVYDENAANRFIIIERRKYREGDKLGDDLTLEGIMQRGLVLRYQDTAFWVDF